jgi:hypothetical protein
VYDSVNNSARIIVSLGVSGPPFTSSTANQPANFARSLFLYESEDSAIQCQAANYFSNGGSLGMQVGDLVMVSSSVPNGGGVTLHTVTAVQSPASLYGSGNYGTGGTFGGSDVGGYSNIAMPGAATIGSASGAQNSVATGLVATGANQAGALALEADINVLATVAANTGAIVPTLNPGDRITICNQGANACAVYPPVGGTINALAENGAYNLATATPLCEITCVSPTLYLARQSA